MSVITAQLTTNKNSGNNISQSYVQDLIRKNFKPTHQIPLELVNRLSSKLSDSANWNKSAKTSTANAHDLTMSQAAERIAAQARFPVRMHYAYYRALLTAMDKLLQNPGIPASRGNIRFAKPVTLAVEMPGEALLTKINLVGRWLGLADLTIKEKLATGKEPLFWKHTSEASQAFHAEVIQRLANLRPEHFITGLTGPTLSDVKNGKVSSAKYTFKTGVPHWNSKLDQLVTAPFATGKTESIDVPTGNLRGIDRIMAAEFKRPWLRDLSAQSGNILKQKLNSGTFATTPHAQESPLQNAVNRFHQKKGVTPTHSSREDAFRLAWASRKGKS
jgi:hypothetical protein